MEYEVEVLAGLEEFAEREIRSRLPGARILGRPREGRVSVSFPGDARRLNELRSVVAVFRVGRFDVPRPRALLGHQNLQTILRLLRSVVTLFPPRTFVSFHLSAAGAESEVFKRLKNVVATDLGLVNTPGPADLLIAVRRPPGGSPGWEVLVRTSPRPLATRPWRVCDLPGALNASIAHVMAVLTTPAPNDRFLNLACGSGTLLIERLALGPASVALGIDTDDRALECARENARASSHADEIVFVHADATRTPLLDQSMTALVADLPFGMLVGTSRQNVTLYPAILREAARVAVGGAPFVVITASRRLLELSLAAAQTAWRLEKVFPLKIPYRSGYLRPAIYLLRRTA